MDLVSGAWASQHQDSRHLAREVLGKNREPLLHKHVAATRSHCTAHRAGQGLLADKPTRQAFLEEKTNYCPIRTPILTHPLMYFLQILLLFLETRAENKSREKATLNISSPAPTPAGSWSKQAGYSLQSNCCQWKAWDSYACSIVGKYLKSYQETWQSKHFLGA